MNIDYKDYSDCDDDIMKQEIKKLFNIQDPRLFEIRL